MKVAVIIQARMGSTRLPGKVMLKLVDKPILQHVIERCRAIPSVSEVVIATTTRAEDDAIAAFASQQGVACHRGSETNVLSRYYEAAKSVDADVIVRVTSDCPLLDPEVSDRIIRMFLDEPDTDYCSNTVDRSFPQGLDTEVFSMAALEKAHAEARKEYELEHVTPYFYQHPELFRISQYVGEHDYSSYRWTVDTPKDYQLIQAVYQALYTPGHLFSWMNGINLVERQPALKLLNANIHQKKLGE